MKIKTVLLAAFLLMPGAALKAGFSEDYAGTTGGQFLKLAKGVRQAGMGEAYCAAGGNLDSIYANPAGLGYISDYQVSAMHTSWFEEIYYQNLSVGAPTAIGVTALSVNYLSMSGIEKYNRYRVAMGEKYRPHDLILYLSYANSIKENLFGVNLFMINSVIEDESASAFGVDLGYIRRVNEYIDAGVSIQNIGTELRFMNTSDPMPLNIKAGFKYRISDSFIMTADLNFPRDYESGLNIGAEYSYSIEKVGLSARAGYRTRPVSAHGDLSGLSMGGQVGYRGFSLDYAWVPYGDLSSTHRFSLSYRFGE